MKDMIKTKLGNTISTRNQDVILLLDEGIMLLKPTAGKLTHSLIASDTLEDLEYGIALDATVSKSNDRGSYSVKAQLVLFRLDPVQAICKDEQGQVSIIIYGQIYTVDGKYEEICDKLSLLTGIKSRKI